MSDSAKTILIVDDDPNLLLGIQTLLKRNGYAVHTAPNGDAGLNFATRECPDLIVSDIRMPGMSGFEFLQQLRWESRTANIPLIFLTASGERTDVLKGFADGADDYIVKPFDPPELLARIKAMLRRVDTIRQSAKQNRDENLTRLTTTSPYGMLLVDQTGTIQYANNPVQAMLGTSELAGKSLFEIMPPAWQTVTRQYLTGAVESPNESIAFECELQRFTGEKFPAQISAVFIHWDNDSEARFTLRDLSEQKQTAAERDHAKHDLLQAYESTLLGWTRALELRDPETKGHSLRVAEWTVNVARALGISEEAIVHLRRGALLHDIGKIGIPDSILLKPGALTADEWIIMRQHPQYAYDILVEIEYLRPALDIPYGHHEKWDGTGYPRGLKGEEIPMAARIFAVVDVWDALTSKRPYRKEWTSAETREYIRNWSGTHFDPMVVNIALRVLASSTRLQ